MDDSHAGWIPPGHAPEALNVLYETVHDLTSTLSIQQVIQRLLRRVTYHLDSEIGSILVCGPDQRLRITHAQGLPREVVETASVPLGEGVSGHVARTGVGLLIEDIERDPRFHRRNHERYYTSSAICVPLRAQGSVIGVLNVNNKRRRVPYTPADLNLVEAIAAHAAVALSNARLYEDTLERARCDALTGLANHGHFWAILEVEIERARRYDRELGLALLDVDHFKGFNDRHGHLGGDEVLAGIAALLRESSRVHDTAARYGGEEFAVVLPETGAGGSRGFAEKVRQAVEAHSFGAAAAGEVTVSVGLAAFPADAESPVRLVEAADARLYAAKSAGRNRVSSEDA